MAAVQYTRQLEIRPWFYDHCFDGQPVLPAVESLVLLAGIVQDEFPGANICLMQKARFLRFFEISKDAPYVDCHITLEKTENSAIRAALLSRRKTGRFSRMIEHASVDFAAHPPKSNQSLPVFPAGDGFSLSRKTMYRDLIPFGPAYQNVLWAEIFPEGASARLATPLHAAVKPLHGSPFLFDSAMHVACAWGQRHAGIVPFPVGFSSRTIREASAPDTRYLTTIRHAGGPRTELTFDIDITDMRGTQIEQIRGLVMRDVSGGRLQPPDWIQATTE